MPEKRGNPLKQILGRPIITSKNAAQLNDVVTGMIEGIVDAEKDEDKKE